MNPKLEELRRRFLPSTDPPAPTLETIFKRGPQVSHGPGPSEQMPASNSAAPAEPRVLLVRRVHRRPNRMPNRLLTMAIGKSRSRSQSRSTSSVRLSPSSSSRHSDARSSLLKSHTHPTPSNSLPDRRSSLFEPRESFRDHIRETFELVRVDSRASGRSRRTC